MSILVINAGSTSLKYKLFSADEEVLKQGSFDNIPDHLKTLKLALREIGDLRDLSIVGHRVVHGGAEFLKPIIINDDNFKELEQYNDLAPLHNPYNLMGIKAAKEFLPNVKQAAVFDTAFFSALPRIARQYALPRELSEKYKIHRYGFHGLSHKYAREESAKLLKKSPSKINIISCHLGGGCSIAAIKNGQPVDTSMGWTPLEGLVMMTRAGDLDPGIIFNLLKMMPGEINREKVEDLYKLLDEQSGIKGLSGYDDYQKFLAAVSLGRGEAELAFEMAINRLVKYIGAYWTLLNGQVDALVLPARSARAIL
jgi:acetate kinase